jgi:argininosuccinate lyase
MREAAGHAGIGDRLVEGPTPELVRSAFAREAEYGPLLYYGMSLADLASTVASIEAGIVPPAIGARLLQALLELHDIPAHEFPFDPAAGDAYTNREQALRELASEVTDWLAAGRARRESSTVGYAIVVRHGLLAVTTALLAAMDAVLERAADNVATLMPDYTYMQIAQPTTLAHYLLGFVYPMTRDLARLRAAFERANRSPAGIGSTNGSRLPLDRERLAHLLGFDGLVVHARDAMWQPDAPVEVMATLVAVLLNLDRLAEDSQIWASAEFNYIELADRHSRSSVIMPHKKNPYGLAYLRGVARDIIGTLAGTAALQATPSGQVDNRIFTYDAVPRALEQTEGALSLLAGIIAGMTVNTDVMRRRACQEDAGATDLAEAVMLAHNLSPRTAHRLVGHAVRLAHQTGRRLDAALLDQAARAVLQRPLSLPDHFIAEQLDSQAIVESRTTIGGAAREQVQSMLADGYAVVATYRAWVTEQQRRLEAAERALIEEARKLCQPT